MGHATWAAWIQSWTIDEPVHLDWSRRVLETGSTNRDDVDSYDSKTPVSMLNVLSRMTAERFTDSYRVQRFAARLPTVAQLAALLAVTWGLARWLGGPWAALIATAGAALDPSLVAHGSLVTVDVPYALATLLALWAGGRLAQRPGPAAGALFGLALGFAFVAKFSAVLLLGAVLFMPLAFPRPWPTGHVRRLALALLVSGVVAWGVLCAGYLFLEVGVPIGGLGFQSAPFRRLAALTPDLPSPVPAAVLTGLDRSIQHDQDHDWPVYLLDRSRPGGVWYYFAFLWLVKTPLLLLLAQALGLATLVASRAALVEPRARYLFASLVISLVYFSFFFRTQLGYRFVLMCVPLAWVLAASGLVALLPRRGAAAGLLLAAGVGLAENLMYLGNPLAFTNAAVWPKREAFRLTGYSNIDWRQNREDIQPLLTRRRIKTRLEPVHVLAGHVTLPVMTLTTKNRPEIRWIHENLDPVEHYLHTYLAFQVTPAQFDAFMDTNRRFASTPGDAARCADGPAGEPIGKGLPFSVDDRPARAGAWLACVEAKGTADVIFKSRTGTIHVGHYTDAGACAGDEVEPDQEVWFRLEPGVHALCLVEPVMRRKWLPYQIEARWLALGRARLALQPAPRPVE